MWQCRVSISTKREIIRKIIATDYSYPRGRVWAGGAEKECLSTVLSVQGALGLPREGAVQQAPSAPGWARRALPGSPLWGVLPPAGTVLGAAFPPDKDSDVFRQTDSYTEGTDSPSKSCFFSALLSLGL